MFDTRPGDLPGRATALGRPNPSRLAGLAVGTPPPSVGSFIHDQGPDRHLPPPATSRARHDRLRAYDDAVLKPMSTPTSGSTRWTGCRAEWVTWLRAWQGDRFRGVRLRERATELDRPRPREDRRDDRPDAAGRPLPHLRARIDGDTNLLGATGNAERDVVLLGAGSEILDGLRQFNPTNFSSISTHPVPGVTAPKVGC
jgi:hypothetical protein